MADILKATLILTAYDRASRVIAQMTNNAEANLRTLNERSKRMAAEGFGLVGLGAATGATLIPAIRAFSELENSSASLQSAMMKTGGTVGAEFERINRLAVSLGNELPGTTADLQNMMEVLLQNATSEQDILDGVGSSAARFAILMKMGYGDAAKFAAQLRISAGVGAKDMLAFLDVIQRTRNLGIDPTEMGYAFGRTGLKQFGLEGLENAKKFAALYSTILPITKSGETTGSGLSRLLTAVFNTDKMKEANDLLSKYGMKWEFVDKATGQFKGVESLVGQLGQLNALTAAQRLDVLTSIFGEGEDRKIAAIIAANGIAGYNQAVARMAGQASLDQKVAVQVATVANLWEAFTGTMTNAWAAMGASIAPEMKKVLDVLNWLSTWVQNFAASHPKLFKFISLTIAASSAILMVAGAIKIVVAAFNLLKLAALTNPVTLIIMAIAAGAILIYTYWGDIMAFFGRVWAFFVRVGNAIGNFFRGLWAGIKAVFKAGAVAAEFTLNLLTPWGMIKNWQMLAPYFAQVWESVKKTFSGFWDWLTGLAGKFWQAGVNIVMSIIDGIGSMFQRGIDAIANLVKGMRAFLPFSPAKAGAFRDLHRVKIVETIAASMRPGPLMAAMDEVTKAARGRLNGNQYRPAFAGAAGGGGLVVNYSPNITIGAGANTDDFAELLRRHKDEISRVVADAVERKKRTIY